MPQMKDRRGEVLRWDEVHAQFAETAKTMPIEDIDLELEAMGYDLGKLNAAASRLDRLSAGTHASSAGADAPLHATAGAPAPSPTDGPASAAEGLRREGFAFWGWRAGYAAGACATVLIALVALPVSQSVVARWFAPSVAKVEQAGRPVFSIDDRVEALIQSVHFDSDPLGFASNLNRVGQLLEAADRPNEAAVRYLEAFAILERHTDRSHPDPIIATVANNLARLLLASDHLDAAEWLLRRALAIDMRNFGPDHPAVARDISNLELVYRARGDCAKPTKACSV